MIEVKYNSLAEEEMIRITVRNVDDTKIVLNLTEKQYKLIQFRGTRSFFIRCKKERVLQEIAAAKNIAELEGIAKKYDFCDVCGFAGINFVGLKRIMGVITEVLYKYPRLRSKMCFIGTHIEFKKLLSKLEQGDNEVLKKFNLQYICNDENIKKLSGMLRGNMERLLENNEAYLAMAMYAYGLFDAMLFDHNDYDGYAYLNFIKNLRFGASTGFYPQGCHIPESVAYHELGHLLDKLCNLNKNAAFNAYYSGLTKKDIRSGLSEYALTSPLEFIAEAFAEFMCNPDPRPISRKVVELLDQAYLSL